ncbi:MAG: cysteine hydrolase [Armatimonadetes bacterium]|nr:cysteine hydrolase [Armatimonadota bacterium]
MSRESDWEFGHGLKFHFRLDPAKTALVVVDMQYASGSRTAAVGMYLSERGRGHLLDWRFTRLEQVVLPNVKRLLAFFREHSLRVLYVTIGSEMEDFSDMPECLRPFARAAGNRVGQPANAILDEVRPLPGERVLRKTTQSAFMSSPINAVLRAMGVEYLCFTGVSTNACVDGTARDAADLNYRCVIVEDCCSATREDHHLAALSSFASQAGRVMATDEAIRELSDQMAVATGQVASTERHGQ